MFPRVRVEGGAYDRGLQYGQKAGDRVRRSITAYSKVFEHYATWRWDIVTDVAREFVPAIDDFGAQYLEEMRGIAVGANVAFEDILAINLRTEIMFAAKVRASGSRLPSVAECSSFASVGPDGTVRMGQNWDWLPHTMETVIVLEVIPDSGPAILTVVEAGLLAKFGVNSAGLGLATNALVSAEDAGEPGVPYHVMLRALLDCETPREALARLQQSPRSSSANYLVSHRSGLAMDIEARPGDHSMLHLIDPDERGVILHTNHFLSERFDSVDVGLWVMPDSPFRLQRLRLGVAAAEDPHDLALFERLLCDHAGHPDSVCCHPNPKEASELDQGLTTAGMLVELSSGRAWLSHGPPCDGGFRGLDLGVLQ